MPRTRSALWMPIAAAIALTAGCSRTDNEPGPGGVTVSEAKALDDAAAMLESRDSIPAPAPKKDTAGKARPGE
ncbi:hypothetical protein FHR22_000054 [Sphingopyxis panaciterrae]|uniref:hypothetical protein n=1 Tax=Sphingopyxis panaciterrae TaxID=363841 RepID=UPI00142172ED|nr:hypothetical protein [Sphingopyxis panaciterrae]NIJ35405.1 hypothetical protein [Sphingopyxis panaciterrae]